MISITLHLMLALAVYIFIILILDRFAGITPMDKWRVKEKKDGCYIQTRWKFSPFWDYYGHGDIAGMDFTPLKFSTKNKAEAFLDHDKETNN